MKQLSVMIKPASASCNLRCRYCFYADVSSLREVPSFGCMRRDTMEKMLDNIRCELSPGDRLTLAFQGGEPTLAGLDYFRALTDAVKKWPRGIRVSYALQTNALNLDDDWCAFLAEHRFLVGVSLDILPQCHDAARVDPAGRGTYRKVCQAIRLLEKYAVEYNVLCTLTNQVARHPRQVWSRILEMNLQYVQFTPCLDTLESPGQSVYALSPKRFASFYIQLFADWLADYRAGRYRSIKLFDDIVNLMAFGAPTACGIQGLCGIQTVVEADGSVYPCDFYCLDQYRLGNIAEQALGQLYQSPAQTAFLTRAHALPKLCESCAYRKFCAGGCPRMRQAVCCSDGDTYCGYQEFLTQCGPALLQIAMEQRR